MKPSQMFAHWERVRADLLETIDRFADAELAYRPFPDSWPVGQIMLHIADCEDNWLHAVIRGEFEPWVFYDLSDYPTKAAIKEVLHNARERTVAFLESLAENDLDARYKLPDGWEFSLEWAIWHVLEHEIHHRGELSLALGLLGRQGLDV